MIGLRTRCSRSVALDLGFSSYVSLVNLGDSPGCGPNSMPNRVHPKFLSNCSNELLFFSGFARFASACSTSSTSRARLMAREEMGKECIEKMKSWGLQFMKTTRAFATSSGQGLDSDLTCPQLEQERVDTGSNLSAVIPSEDDIKHVCGILSSSKDWHAIEEALERCGVNFTPELVLKILCSCRVHGNTVLRFFSWVGQREGYSHGTDTYNMAMKIAGGAKDFKHMRTLFYEMRRKGCLITSHTWTIMIMQYGRAGLTSIALSIFKEMKANGCQPSGSTYKFLIISLCARKGRKVDEAIRLFKEMMTNTDYVPDKEFVEHYLGCLCECNKLSDARKCLSRLHKVGFGSPLTHSLYIRALCRAGKLDEALKRLNDAGGERETVSKYVYGSIVHGLLRKGKLEEALSKVEHMKQQGVSPTVHVYTSLIVHYFKVKEVEKALEMFERMAREGCEPTVITYSALIRGYVDVGKVDDAHEVFNRMKSKGPSPDFRTYSMFIDGLCRVGRSEEASQLISEMLDGGIVPSSVNFRTVFFGLNREGKQDSARLVLQRKLELTKQRKLTE